MKILYRSLLILIFAAIASGSCLAQGYVKTEYLTSSDFMEDGDKKLGSGDLLKISGGYNQPLSMKQDSRGPIMWAGSVRGAYGIFNNRNMTEDLNPDNILNVSLNITHMRPLSEKWYLMATLGGGIYSEPDAITAKSILFNGGAIFMWRARKNLDLGIGLGLTNSYGTPVAMPMLVVKWSVRGNYEVNVDIAGGIDLSVAMKLSDRIKLKLTALEMDGMSAVMEVDGRSKIYATSIMRSYLSAEYATSGTSVFYLGAGSAWMRSVSLTNRNLGEFFDNMFSKDRDLEFKPSVYITAGFRFGYPKRP